MKLSVIIFLLGILGLKAQDSLLIFPLTHGGTNDFGGVMTYNINQKSHQLKALEGNITNFGITEGIDVDDFYQQRYSGALEKVNDSIFIIENPLYHMSMEANTYNGGIYTYNQNNKETKYIYNAISDSVIHGYRPVNGFAHYNNLLIGYFNQGGQFNGGCIFGIDKTTFELQILHQFNPGSEGAHPSAQPFISNGILYGALEQSSDGNGYALFKFDLDALAFTSILDSIGGVKPKSIYSILQWGDSLVYGVDSNLKVFNLNNNTENIYHTFPENLILEINYLKYHAASQLHYIISSKIDGTNLGSLISFNINTPNQLNTIHQFNNDAFTPVHKLVEGSGNTLYGICNKIKTAATPSSDLKPFKIENNQIEFFPQVEGTFHGHYAIDFTLNDQYLNYTSFQYGSFYNGTITNIDTNTFAFNIHSLSSPNGANPFGCAISLDSENLIFPTFNGGYQNAGGFLKYHLIDQSFSLDYVNIIESDHSHMTSNLVQSNNEFFCLAQLTSIETQNDQSHTKLGKFFIYPETPGFFNSSFQPKKAISVSGISNTPLNNSKVNALLVSTDTTVIGASVKELFSYKSTTNVLSSLHVFDSLSEGYDVYDLLLETNMLYGTLKNGGANGRGALFQYDFSNNTFAILSSFPATYGQPMNLTLRNDSLFGTFNFGGVNNLGGVYVYDISGNQLTKLHDFSSTSGSDCYSKITSLGTNFYTLSNKGGAHQKGTLIEFNLNEVNVLIDFDQNTGYSSKGNGIFFYIDTISSKPEAPTAETFQAICINNATLNDLVITGNQIKWYDTENGGNLLPNNTPLANNGEYYASQTVNGDESYFRTRVHVSYEPLNKNLTISNDTLFSSENSAFYQWLNCNNYTPIPGATLNYFRSGSAGSFAVEISNGTCKDTSNCIEVIGSGIASDFTINTSIYPNPFKNGFNLTTDGPIKTIQLFNIIGKAIAFDLVKNRNQTIIYPSSQNEGIIILHITYENNQKSTYRLYQY